MRILLVGEFSRLHNSLKEGLAALGHEVMIVASGDDFKQYPVDFSIAPKTVASSFWLKYLNKITITLFGLNLDRYEKAIRFYRFLPELKNYDVVQLINSDALECPPGIALRLYKRLFAQNGRKFLLVCGEETPITDVLLGNTLKYSVFTPYFNDPKTKKHYTYSLQFAKPAYRKLFNYLREDCDGILASDLDYKIPLEKAGIPSTFIPNPVNTDKIRFQENDVEGKIIVFLGINKYNFIKKGTLFFEQAIAEIRQKYPEKINVLTVNSLPYEEYKKHVDKAHIVLDQVYSFDQGYNALEAMAKGKVVFTGAESEFYDHYRLKEKVAVNALPDAGYLVAQLSALIEHPEKIRAMGIRARAFIENEHHYITIAAKYLKAWGQKT